ncbi:hypothetical protein HYH02_001115 [Chlamydomonas schloesseri]|uniref:Uncharacterized protein n=1 Tax=Chlamydomonas schloesseri TaxID=2026947 RepID=A0A835WUR8_9CHLO|nr:hypothetical protein HYH02_001115 [Chlamydomonas schloesseri]|eukprot:KAG2454075.1 hypothetical protein HYH02_001115 [Chlamydomonas schloesseri]
MARRSSAAAAVAVLAMALCLMGAAQARKSAIMRTSTGRMLLANTNAGNGGNTPDICPAQPSPACASFYSTCVKITCVNLVVTVDVSGSGCKGSSYSWGACLKWGFADTRCGLMTSCTGAANGDYCETLTKVSFAIDATDTKVGIQIHDGSFTTGTNNCTLSNPLGTGCWAGSPHGTCPAMSYFTAAGIPGVDSCTPCASKDCLVETQAGDFTKPLAAANFLDTYHCIAKPSGTFLGTNPITGAQEPYPMYPPMVTSTYAGLNDYFAANTAVGASVAVACYTDDTYATVSRYLYVSRISTATDNYKCLTCKWYSVFEVKPGACKCSTDTAWAIPPKNMMEGLAATTGEQALTGSLSGVYWTARQDASKANAWGGYFRIVPPHDTTVIYTFDVCAGCGQNRVNKGFIMGQLTFAISNINGKTSYTQFVAPSLTASTTSSVLHMYQSFIAPPSLTPGQFSKFTSVSGPSTLPFTYGDSWTSTVLTGTIKSGSSSWSVPSSESSNGVYVAIHLTVGGSMCF